MFEDALLRQLAAVRQNDYNHRRTHSSLGYRTPAAYAASLGGTAPESPASKPPESTEGRARKPGSTRSDSQNNWYINRGQVS